MRIGAFRWKGLIASVFDIARVLDARLSAIQSEPVA
jgi:hypothetical protein